MTSTPVYLLDTNVIVRLIVGDELALTAAAQRVFDDAAAGRHALVLLPSVIAETVYVLTSVYRVPRSDVAVDVRRVSKLAGVEVRSAAAVERAFDLFLAHRKLKWVDAYLLALAESENVGVASLDRPLARAAPPGVAVLDPSRT